MRIVVHGQQAFGKAVLEALIKRGEDVVAVYVAPEKEGAKADPLKEAALAAKLPVYQPASYRKPEVWEEFRALKPDLQVMAFVTLFVPEEFLNIPTHGSIQYHPSLLPAYRGPSAINWPIIKGETETGLSIFWPDNGLDTGDVLLQKKTPIGPHRHARHGLFRPPVPDGGRGDAGGGRSGQGRQGAAHQAGRSESDLRRPLRPRQRARSTGASRGSEIDRLIRGCNPAPGAWSTLDGKTVKIFEAKPLPAKDPKGIAGKMGEIVAVEADGFTVVCADGRFKVARVQPADGKKIEAGEWTSASRRNAQLPGVDIHRIASHRNGSDRRLHARRNALNGSQLMPASQHQNPKSDIEISQAAKKRPHPRHRQGKARHRAGESRALWPLQGQGLDGLHQVAARTGRTAS